MSRSSSQKGGNPAGIEKKKEKWRKLLVKRKKTPHKAAAGSSHCRSPRGVTIGKDAWVGQSVDVPARGAFFREVTVLRDGGKKRGLVKRLRSGTLYSLQERG